MPSWVWFISIFFLNFFVARNLPQRLAVVANAPSCMPNMDCFFFHRPSTAASRYAAIKQALYVAEEAIDINHIQRNLSNGAVPWRVWIVREPLALVFLDSSTVSLLRAGLSRLVIGNF
jgi:hypothetical protein